MKNYSEMTQYEKEVLAALYKSEDFMRCNDLPADQVVAAIIAIESQYSEAA